ncbi:MAG: SDR family oxidoreductase [Proteobacteria bacterium]|nr:SDR family oxidoreductase [Pseudomonadota bacterium]NCA27824.1 SDR family oxidoreductase [Pseudomonadota bacterium]
MANYLILSASSDIGELSSRNLIADNHKVFVTARNPQKLESLKSTLNCNGKIVDCANFEAVDDAFDEATKTLGNLDGVACFAGSVILKPAHLTNFEEYQQTIASNLTCAFACVRSAGKFLKNGGSVVLMASGVALHGLANHEAIACAKGGIVALAKSASSTYASKNIRFNVVAPGLTNTKLTRKITDNETSLNYSKAMHALGRIGEAQDIANAVNFLLDIRNNFITGQVLAVDGGLSSVMPKIKI